MIRRTTFLSATLAVSMGVSLFVIKYQVQDLEDQLTKIDHQIVTERQTIHVLKAEWSHLNEPGRLRRLAVHYLGLVPINYKQFLTDAMFAQRLGENIPASKKNGTGVKNLSFEDRMKLALEEGTER